MRYGGQADKIKKEMPVYYTGISFFYSYISNRRNKYYFLLPRGDGFVHPHHAVLKPVEQITDLSVIGF